MRDKNNFFTMTEIRQAVKNLKFKSKRKKKEKEEDCLSQLCEIEWKEKGGK